MSLANRQNNWEMLKSIMGKFWSIIDLGLTGIYILQSYNIAIRI